MQVLGEEHGNALCQDKLQVCVCLLLYLDVSRVSSNCKVWEEVDDDLRDDALV